MDAPPSNATAPGPRRKSTRVRRPNVTLDLEGVYLERLRSKKDARSGFASYVSARAREITDLLSDKRNLQAVKEKLAHAIKAFDNFKNAHYEYWFEVRDEKGSAECDKYLAKHVDDFSVFRRRVSDWIAVAEDKLLSLAPEVDASIKPEDSVSNVGSQARSSTSKHSRHSKQSGRASSRGSHVASVEAARTKEAARFAELEAEKVMLDKRQALEERKFRLSQEEARLNLEAEMAKSAAKGQALAAMVTPSFQPLQHPFKLEFKSEDDGDSSVLNNPNYRERQSEHARFYPRNESSCVDAPRVSENVANEADRRNSRDDFQQETMVLHRQQTALQVQQNRIVELLAVNQNKSKLPQPRVPIFDGNPVDYRSFVRAFESLIESRTQSSTERLYYLEQYTAGDVKELIRSCHHLPPDEGYEEARSLLKRKFGDEYRIASAYESKALGWPPIKPEDGSALSKFAIFLSSCKNALASSQYASKFDQPGSIQKLIFKLPFRMREKWRRHVDYIMELQSRPVNFSDLVAFVDQEARIATNPVFGDISDKTQSSSDFRSRRAPQTSPGFKPPKPKTSTFATQLQSSGDQNSRADVASANVQPSLCLFCQKNHALEDCHLLRWKPYQERIKFLASKRLCFGCLSDKHVARFCPERKACKFPNCTRKHPTVLHTSSNRDKCSVDVGVGTENSTEAPVLNGMVNTDKCLNGLNQEARRRTAMAVIPVKVRSKENNKSVITYAFLDNGSSATFCTESLMKQLGVDGAKVKISLSTLEKKNSPVDSYLIRDLVVSDLDENDFVNLPILYTRPEIPVNVEDIPTQEDVDCWPYLHDVFIPHVDAEIGLLIASDVPEALDPVEMRHSRDGGPYASRTRIGWAVNGPLGRCRKGSQTSGFFVKVDPQLQLMVENFYNHGFADTFADDTTEMSQDERRFMQNAEKIQFKFGHYEIPLPFKNPEALVPNNKSQALTRVGWLKKRLEKDSKLSDDYRTFMSDLLAKGYARKVPPVQTSPDVGKAWYIPHHGVYHPINQARLELSSIVQQTSKDCHLTACCTKVPT